MAPRGFVNSSNNAQFNETARLHTQAVAGPRLATLVPPSLAAVKRSTQAQAAMTSTTGGGGAQHAAPGPFGTSHDQSSHQTGATGQGASAVEDRPYKSTPPLPRERGLGKSIKRMASKIGLVKP